MSFIPTFVITQGSTAPAYTATLTHPNGNPVDLSTAVSVTLYVSNYFTNAVSDGSATIVNAPTGQVSYTWQPQDLSIPGVYAAEWEVLWTGGGTGSYPKDGYATVTIMNNLTLGFPNVTAYFNTIISGPSAPTSANGNNGDFWYNTTTGYFYGPKSGGVWPTGYPTEIGGVSLSLLLAPTADFSMGGFKLTHLANGIASTDAATVGQIPSSSSPLAVASGGTGQNTLQAAMDSLAGAVTAGEFLRGNGTDVVMASIVSGDIPNNAANTTGSAGSFTSALVGDVTGIQGATVVGKIQGIAITANEATLVSNLTNGTTRSATATLTAGEETIFTGSTASQTLTLPVTPTTSTVNTVTNTASVPVTLAPGAGATLSNFGTSGSIVIPSGYVFQSVYISSSTTWYVQSCGPSDFAKNGALAVANGGTGSTTPGGAATNLNMGVTTGTGAATSGTTLSTIFTGPTLAANSVAAGTMYEFFVTGICTTTVGTQTFNMGVYYGTSAGTQLLSTGAITFNSGGAITGVPFTFKGVIAFVSTTQAVADQQTYGNYFLQNAGNMGLVTVSTTTSKNLVLTATCSASGASMTPLYGYFRQIK